MRSKAHYPRRMRAITLATAMLLGTIVGPAERAKADPGCVNGGVYAMFVHGSYEHLNDKRAHQFYLSVKQAVEASTASDGSHVSFAFSELGNEDGDVYVNMADSPDYSGVTPPKPNASDEYPANILETSTDPLSVQMYDQSVTIGMYELVAHLNNRVTKCPYESIVLGGYSQGADVVGWALQSSNLLPAVGDHIGFVALYGDPKFYAGPLSDRVNRVYFSSQWWWVRGDDPGYRDFGLILNNGILGQRAPYVLGRFVGRFGSWCAAGDVMCAGYVSLLGDVHGTKYQDGSSQVCPGHYGWISCSAAEIAWAAVRKRNALNPSVLPATSGSYTAPDPNSGPVVSSPDNTTPPPPPTILQVKRSLAPDGTTHEVYAATNSTVTEGWWHPGADGVRVDQIITISQTNIVGIDKVNMPDGVTQAVYTAVPDGVWESWWRSGTGVSSAKIVTGLSGVRQVIAANVYEGSQFVHRLYLLASDGPYEAWWKDGGDGVHVDRLNNIAGGVAMAAGTGSDGSYEVFVATPTWVYELWWLPGQGVNARSMVNITQGDIRSLSWDTFQSNGQLLYTGTSTTAWQSYWTPGSSIETHAAMSGQAGAFQIRKDNYGGSHELYSAMPDHIQEFWWLDNGTNGIDTVFTAPSGGTITSLDKSDDGSFQQIYSSVGNVVYETYWGGGASPTTNVLYSVPS